MKEAIYRGFVGCDNQCFVIKRTVDDDIRDIEVTVFDIVGRNDKISNCGNIIEFFKNLKKVIKYLESNGLDGKKKAIGFLDDNETVTYSMIALDDLIKVNFGYVDFILRKRDNELKVTKKDVKKIINWLMKDENTNENE